MCKVFGSPSSYAIHGRIELRLKKWFGDWENDPANASKVVDENGEPLVVYHNTSNEFTKFSKFRAFVASLTGSNMFGRGFYFSNHQGTSLGSINMPVFLRVVNPSEGDMTSKNDGMIHSFGNGEVWYAAKNPNQIKSATDNNGDFSTENDDIQMAIGREKVSLNNTLTPQEKSSIRTLLKTINRTGTTLLDNGEGTMYLLDHADREDIENRNPQKEDGFNCRLKFSTDGYTREDINNIKTDIENGNIQNQKDFDRWASMHPKGQGSNNSDSLVAEVRRPNADNAGLYSEARQGESTRGRSDTSSQEDFGTDFIKVRDNDGTNGPRYIPVNTQEDSIQTFSTPEGEVYGFVDKDGNI